MHHSQPKKAYFSYVGICFCLELDCETTQRVLLSMSKLVYQVYPSVAFSVELRSIDISSCCRQHVGRVRSRTLCHTLACFCWSCMQKQLSCSGFKTPRFRQSSGLSCPHTSCKSLCRTLCIPGRFARAFQNVIHQCLPGSFNPLMLNTSHGKLLLLLLS